MARIRTLRRSAPRRMVQWLQLDLAATNVGAGSVVLLGTLNAAALALRPFTLVRTIGQVMITGNTGIFNGAFGLAHVTEPAAAAGIASLPTPISEADSNAFQTWIPIQSQGFQIAGAGAADITMGQLFQSFDSKSMRKVGPDDDLAFVAESSDVSVNLSVIGRLLIKLH